jgi:carbonic anhydrase
LKRKESIGLSSLEQLKAGNKRFVQNTPQIGKELSQKPIAIILACSDSRVNPSIIFDQGLGKLFVIRVAGNVVDQTVLASIEFGIDFLKTPLLVILGHQNCRAVEASFDLANTKFSANIKTLLEKIQPAVNKVKKLYPHKNHEELFEVAISENMHQVHQNILKESPLVQKHFEQGMLTIVEGKYHIDTRQVEWSE